MTLRIPALCSNAEGKRSALALNGSGAAAEGGVPDLLFVDLDRVFLGIGRHKFQFSVLSASLLAGSGGANIPVAPSGSVDCLSPCMCRRPTSRAAQAGDQSLVIGVLSIGKILLKSMSNRGGAAATCTSNGMEK